MVFLQTFCPILLIQAFVITVVAAALLVFCLFIMISGIFAGSFLVCVYYFIFACF